MRLLSCTAIFLAVVPALAMDTQVHFSASPAPSKPSHKLDIGDDFALRDGSDVFSPRDLIELVRPGSGAPNPSGDLVLVPVSKYSIEKDENQKSIYIASIDSENLPPYQVVLAKGGEAFWLDDRTVGHVVTDKDTADGAPQLFAHSVEYSTEQSVLAVPGPPVLVGTFPHASVANFVMSPSNILVFSAEVYKDRDLSTVKEQDEKWEKRGSSALVYEKLYVRHWDAYRTPKRNSLFSVQLSNADDGSWSLGDKFNSLLKDTDHASPVEPFGGTDDFDVSETHVIYTTLDPNVPPAWHTRQNVYIVPIEGGERPTELTGVKHGATHSPVLSPKGDKAAWLELAKDGNEADRARIVILDLEKQIRFFVAEHWDRSPSSVVFSPDGTRLYLIAGEHARVKIFALHIPRTPSASDSSAETLSVTPHVHPHAFTRDHTVSSLVPTKNGNLVFTRSSLTSPNNVFVLSGIDRHPLTDLQSHVHQVTDFAARDLQGKALDKGTDFWFEGAEGVKVHGWLLKPPGFKHSDKKKWPVVLLIHGGPQGAWEDNWSTRWNPNVFANQGYVVVAINPAGSTTFGQDFTDAISGDWGGRPFVDLQKGWKHILEKVPAIDPDRAVAAGASWGGFAINWIAGHPEFDFGFKALFCHDGVFDTTYSGFVTDELFFFEQEFNAPPFTKLGFETAEKFNPARFVHKWETPMLIVHGGLDYRLPVTDGISAFQGLQRKGISSRLVIFPDENHWVLNHKNSIKWHWEVFRWFNKHVGEQ